jgi:hypothetical protein
LALIAVLIVPMCGSPPSRRYRRLWGDIRYQSAVARLIGKPGHTRDPVDHGADAP